MKKLLLIFLILNIQLCFSQEKGLIVNYNQQTKFDIEKMLGKNYFPEEKKALLETMKRIEQYTLSTTQNRAISKKTEKINNDQKENGITVSFGSSKPIFHGFRE